MSTATYYPHIAYNNQTTKPSVFTRFMQWCENQEKNRLFWLGIALGAQGCVLLPFAMLADTNRRLSQALGILDEEAGVAKRATFLVDPEGIIRFVYVTDMSVGRNPAEVLRVLDALQTDELCPCNWQKGEDVLKPAA